MKPDWVSVLCLLGVHPGIVIATLGDRDYGISDYSVRDLHGYVLSFGHPARQLRRRRPLMKLILYQSRRLHSAKRLTVQITIVGAPYGIIGHSIQRPSSSRRAWL